MDSLLEDNVNFLTTDRLGRHLKCAVNCKEKYDECKVDRHLNNASIKQCFRDKQYHGNIPRFYQSFLTLPKYHCTSLVTANSNSDFKSPLDNDVDKFLANETAWERMKRTYNLEDNVLVENTPQRNNIAHGCTIIACSTFAFNLYKGYLDNRGEFKNKYALVLFRSQGQAQKRRYNFIVKSSMDYAIKATWKMTKVFLPILVIQQLLEVYWNKTTPLSFIASCGGVGFMSSLGMDVRGMFARTVIGSALGAVGGLIWTGAAVMTGQTQEELNRQNVVKLLKLQQQIADGKSLFVPKEIKEEDKGD